MPQGPGVLLCPQTMSQARRTRLKRAFTEITSDTVTYVKTVGRTTHYNKLIYVSTYHHKYLPTHTRYTETYTNTYTTVTIATNHWPRRSHTGGAERPTSFNYNFNYKWTEAIRTDLQKLYLVIVIYLVFVCLLRVTHRHVCVIQLTRMKFELNGCVYSLMNTCSNARLNG